MADIETIEIRTAGRRRYQVLVTDTVYTVFDSPRLLGRVGFDRYGKTHDPDGHEWIATGTSSTTTHPHWFDGVTALIDEWEQIVGSDAEPESTEAQQ